METNNKPHNIVVCCDGTWCGAETGTRGNIQIVADGFASQGQNAYVHTLDGQPVHNSYTNTDICYFNGVGLDGLEDLAKEGKQMPLLGLLGGFGDTLLYIANGIIANDLPERCKEAYGFIMDKYQGPGVSRVWLFGLSRGAYTVRAVAGMVNNCGIVKPAADDTARSAALQDVWEMYRDNDEENRPGGAKAIAFRKEHSWPRGSVPPIIFMGLLDTVGAEGIPRIQPQGNPANAFTYSYSFRDVVVSSEVQHVFQAASVHDRLAPFEPCPVRRSSKIAGGGDAAGGSSEGHYPGVSFSLQEVWFPGAHYDVGRQDFVFSNQPATNTLFRVLNPLRTNVNCTPELADYPLLGRALPAHGGPSPPQRLIGVPHCAAPNYNEKPWIWALQQLTAGLPLPLFQPAYTIDAESKILGPVVGVVARLLDTQPTLLLKDRTIPPPTAADRYGLPVGVAVFFPVPADSGSFDSYKPRGRPVEWFISDTYVTYQEHLQSSSPAVSSSAAGTVAAPAAAAAAAAAPPAAAAAAAPTAAAAAAAPTAAPTAAPAAAQGALVKPATSGVNVLVDDRVRVADQQQAM
ncbi:hypothetical protein OEZ86_011225 [Tetradesmus obliquus]|nr:hypothetical protein OEZ86_011225 [Tetradesmus obliquus]